MAAGRVRLKLPMRARISLRHGRIVAAVFLLCLASRAIRTNGAAKLPSRPPLGNPHARVRVYIFEDLECPDCAQWHKLLRSQLLPRYGQRVAFYLRDYPLPQHTWAFNAAVLERYFAAHNTRLYFAWVDYCYSHQAQLTSANLMRRAARLAAGYDISRDQLDQAFAKTRYFRAVESDQALGNRIGIHHTPTIYLTRPGGVEISTPAQLQRALQQRLQAQR